MRIDDQISLEENELKPNLFVANAMLVVLLVAVCIEVLNELDVFHVDRPIMQIATLAVVASALVVQVLGRKQSLSGFRGTKYIILTLVTFVSLVVVVLLGQWGELSAFLPLMLSLQYHNRAVNVFGFVAAALVAFFSPPLTFLLGLAQTDYYVFLLQSCGVIITDAQLTFDPNFDRLYYVGEVTKYLGIPKMLTIVAVGAISFTITGQHAGNISERTEAAKDSRTDTLTQLANRLSYTETLNRYARNTPSRLFCFYADADGLHQMNETKGHLAGDAFLRACATQLTQVFGDLSFRIGGDEFVCFAEDCTEEKAQAAVDMIQKNLQAQGYHVSIGYCGTPSGGSLEETLNKAEEAMFAAKRAYYSQEGIDRRRH
ncbi:MAG: GGDEF domain-containing protein [Coriobacteriia bacterium]|nr:GGDEF domain-containing protein [Coriobacteriia bacterium]